jgi:beta-glucosidase
MSTRKIIILFALLSGGSSCFLGQKTSGPDEARIDRLLSEMTLYEKLTMIHGTAEDTSTYRGQAGDLAGVPRLGIPPVRFADGPPGILTRVPSIAPTATMGLAATFSRADTEANPLHGCAGSRTRLWAILGIPKGRQRVSMEEQPSVKASLLATGGSMS